MDVVLCFLGIALLIAFRRKAPLFGTVKEEELLFLKQSCLEVENKEEMSGPR